MPPESRRTVLKTGAAVATVGLTGLAGCVGGGGDDDTLGFNFVVPVENLGSLLDVPEIQDELDGLGDEYELTVSQDSSTPDSINAIAAGETDMALVTTESFGSAVTGDAVPGGLTAIATDFWDAHPDHFGFEIYSLPDSDVSEPEDLEGATLGVNSLGTGIHAVWEKQLDNLGLDSEEDIEYVEQGFATFVEGLEDGIFDAAIFPGLYAVEPRNEEFNLVFDSQEAFGEEFPEGYPFAYTVASNDALDEKGDQIEAWANDYVDVVDYIEENRDEVVSLAADHFEIDEAQLDEFFLTENDYYREQIEIDEEALQGIMDELASLGILEDDFDVGDHVTNEYIT
jgi:sulfonate transport system substrate-binding protein